MLYAASGEELNPKLIKSLNSREVEYMVVGGYAVIYHDYPRTTRDLDLWINQSKENYGRLKQAMNDFGMPIFDMTEDNFLNNPNLDVFRFGRPPVCIEILNTVKGLNFEEAFTNAITNLWEEVAIRFLSREDLIKAKKASNRPRDINDIENLPE
jgi:hypothetical protein